MANSGRNIDYEKRDSIGSGIYCSILNILRASKNAVSSSSSEPALKKKNSRIGNLSNHEHSRRTFASLVVYYNRHDAWLTPVPWDSKVQFECEDMHVELEAQVWGRDGKINKGYSKRIRDLFEPIPGSRYQPKNVLVRGDSGYGKSTMCRKIAHYWAAQGKALPGFDDLHTVIVYLKLNTMQEDAVLEDELMKLVLQEENFSRDDPFFRKTKGILRAFGRNVLLILDGYDEVSDFHQEEVERLLRLNSKSIFKEASIIVTCRPNIHADFVSLFQSHFILQGLSKKSTQKVILNYFHQSQEISARLYKEFVKRFKFKELSPLLLTMLCYCKSKDVMSVPITPYQIIRDVVLLTVKRSNERLQVGLSDERLDQFLFRLGEYLFQCLEEKKTSFTYEDLEDSLPEDYAFAPVCGLFKTASFCDAVGLKTLEPVHIVLLESAVAYFLEERWLSCLVDGDFAWFLDNMLSQLDCLNVCYCANRDNLVNFRASFTYAQFRFSYEILEGVEMCSVYPSSEDANEAHACCLVVSLNITLDNNRDLSSVTDSLEQLFPNHKSLSCLPDLISSARFKTISFKFYTDGTSIAKACFTNLKGKVDQHTDKANFMLNPWTSLVNFCEQLEIVYSESSCDAETIHSVLGHLLQIENDYSSFQNAHRVIEQLRRENCRPSFVRAYVQTNSFQAKANAFETKVFNRLPVVLRLFAKPDFSWQNCDKLVLGFKRSGLSSNRWECAGE